MDAEWSVAAAADDPVLIVPWSSSTDEAGAERFEEARVQHFIDLRADPARIDDIPEAAHWPELRTALLQLNAANSPVFTAKCDAWELSEEERQLDFGPVANGIGAYIDILPLQIETYRSLSAQIAMARRLTASVRPLPPPDARLDCILRPAQWRERAGYALTLHIFGYGDDLLTARAHWTQAIEQIVDLVLHALSTS